MKRYQVIKQYIKLRGVVYYPGDLLPEAFGEREWHRHIHKSWIAPISIELPPPVVKQAPPKQPAKPAPPAAKLVEQQAPIIPEVKTPSEDK